MPRAPEHERISLRVGLAAAALSNAARQSEAMARDPARPFDWADFARTLAAAIPVSVIAGAGPDLAEPARRYGPRHRGPCHSVTALALAVGVGVWAQSREGIEPAARDVITAGAVSYAAHLWADAQTPAGLRLL